VERDLYTDAGKVETWWKVLSTGTMADGPTEKKQKRPEGTFSSFREARALSGPERGKSPFEYPHAAFNLIKLRVHPPSSDGVVRRQLVIRVKFTVGDRQEEDRSSFLELSELEGLPGRDAEKRFVAAVDAANKRIDEIDELRRASPAELAEANKKATRMTLGDAWKRHPIETRLQRNDTTAKEQSLYRNYLAPLADHYLDELTYANFWSVIVGGLGQGKMLNADLLTWRQLDRATLSESTILGILNLGSKLIGFAHNVDGLGGKGKDWNPALQAKKLVGTPNKRRSHIPLRRIADAWRASDVLCSNWARDQLRLYLLTGLRHSLMVGLEFQEVDAKARTLNISPHKRGTKRHGSKTAANAPAMVLPLSRTALAIIEARRPWAPEPDGPVWYTHAQPGGKAAKDAPRKPFVVNSDPRSNWSRISEHVLDGLHFGRHDLRRTFAIIAVAAGADLMGASLLMLHSPSTLARVLGLPEVSIDYMNSAEAQQQMRSASNSIERYLRGVLDGTITFDDDDDEPDLPSLLELAVGNDDDTE
jgi:integrase